MKHWGWGWEDEQLSPQDTAAAGALLREHLGFAPAEVEQPVPLEAVVLPEPRLHAPAALAEITRADVHARARHAHGSSYRDVVRGFRGRFENPPDVVARPRDEAELERVLEWATGAGAAVIGLIPLNPPPDRLRVQSPPRTC